ncbi:MAG: formate/nitrite transporter family protein [Candidatus Eisenbacteria bacterium]|nr:formate/nitrite transporter family protein [Candidatus Eisenbacteria bacterium]
MVTRPTFRHGARPAAPGLFVTLLRGIFAGWLIAMVVWLQPPAQGARILVILLLTWLVGTAHLSHVIAGSVEVAYHVAADGASWTSDFLAGFFVPALLGNTIGGVSLVAALTLPDRGPHGTFGPCFPSTE